MKTKLLYLMLFVFSYGYAQFPTNGLIAQYGFDNGSLLVDGANGQSFTQVGTALTEVNDRFGAAPTSAIKLNGDYLTRPDIAIGEYYSYSFWIKTGTTSTARQVIIDDSNRTATNSSTWTGTRVTLNNGNVDVSIRYRISTSGSLNYRGLTSVSTLDVRDNKWHHIAVSLKSRRYTNNNGYGAEGSTRIYVDGVSQDYDDDRFGSSVIHTSVNGTGNLTVANDRANTLPVTERYDGEIDDILIYNRNLSTAEIQSIISYNNYCSAPLTSVVTVSGVTETTANVDITNNGNQYDLAYHKTSEPFSNATIITGITSGTATSLTSLDVSKDYNLYVREQCTNISDWSDAIPFTTLRPIGKLYVNKNASGANNGLSRADAFTSLQDALVNVVASEEIWIAEGTYKPHTVDRDVYFVIDKENLKLYGGFSGTETNLSDRVLGNNETVLSGDLSGDDVNLTDFYDNYDNATRKNDNSYRIINITADGNNLILDGLTISDAHNNASATARGAAILKEKTVSDLTLRNCIIKDNLGRNDNAGLVAEFELNNRSGVRGKLVIENSKFINNMSRWASGLYVFLRESTNVEVNVSNTLFDSNLSGDLTATVKGISGSAAWFRASSNYSDLNVQLANNTFVNNIDVGTDQSMSNFTRAVVGISKTNGTSRAIKATVSNSIFWGNTTVSGSVTRSITDLYKNPGTINVFNSIDQANFNDSSITTKVNSNNADPLFLDAVNKDFTLSTGSPAIDSGDNTKILAGVLTDLIGNSRVFNTTVDMGAYEFGSSVSVNRTLTINATNGTVTTNPNPTNGIYADGSMVTLTATPATGYQFDGWSGDASGTTNPLNITMDADKTVTAIFSLIQRRLTIVETNTTVTVSPSPVNGTYADGTVVTLTAVADVNHAFGRWNRTGYGSNSTNPLVITLNSDVTVYAISDQITRTLNVNTTITSSQRDGFVAHTEGTIVTNNFTQGQYINGTNVSLEATPRTVNHQFDGWTGDVTSTANPLALTMDSDKTILANFSIIQHTLTVNAVNGTVTRDVSPTNGTYDQGTNVLLTAVPATGYQFTGWSGDESGTSTSFYIGMDADKTVTANFSLIPIVQRILTLNSANGIIVVSPSPINGTYDDGTVVTLTATPNAGFGFVNWSDDASGTINPITITIDANKTVTANFSATAGVSDENKVVFSIYPNPTTSVLNIKMNSNLKRATIYSIIGTKVLETTSKNISTLKLKIGLYLIKIEDETGSVTTKRFMKN